MIRLASLLTAIIVSGAHARPNHENAAPAYRVTRWSLADGAPAGVRAIAQTSDGFLWLGTAKGLYRFDGITFERIEPERQRVDRSYQINALLPSKDGLFVGYAHGGMGVVRRGKLVDVRLPAKVLGYIAQLAGGTHETIWALRQGADMAWLGHLQHGKWRWFHSGSNLPNQPGQSILQARNGDTYLAMYPSVLRLRQGARRFERLPAEVSLGAKLLEDGVGRIWILDEKSVRPLQTPTSSAPLPPLLFDNLPRPSMILRSGELLVGDDEAALRYRLGVAPSVLAPLPIRSVAALAGTGRARTLSMFEDREGNIWIGRATGLDRLTRGGPAIVSPNLDLTTGLVKAGREGRIYVGTGDGLYRLNGLGEGPSRIALAGKRIYTLCGAVDGRLLVADSDRTFLVSADGALHLIRQNNNFVTQTCAVDATGVFWVQKHGRYSVRDGRFVAAPASYGPQQAGRILRAVGPYLVNYINLPYIVKLQDGHTTQLWHGDDIVIGSVSTVVPFDAGFIAVGEYGLAYYDGKHFSVLAAHQYPFLTALSGLVTTHDGQIWMIGFEGIFRVATEDLRTAFNHPGTRLNVARFGREQGLASRLSAYDSDDVIEDADGKIWLNTNQGLAWVDPVAGAGGAVVPPNVIIRSLQAGSARYTGKDAAIRLPPGTTDLRFDFTALGLTDATANRFRYRLDGRDESWTDAGPRREAFYTNIGPGEYVFRVRAANSNGIWSTSEATLPFAIQPAFYQTGWFKLLLGGLALLAVWLLYRTRLAVLGQRLRQRIEGQVEERERIARELHDTFLQSVQALNLRFQAIAETTPVGSKERLQMEDALDRSDEVLTEGRERVSELRNVSVIADLEERLTPLLQGRETLKILGTRRPVRAAVVDQIVPIAREALLNARRHAAATDIEVSVAYWRRGLTVIVRDNGIGIDSMTAERERPGHYGLRGMRERANTMHARVSIKGAATGGTTICLRIPARTAFKTGRSG